MGRPGACSERNYNLLPAYNDTLHAIKVIRGRTQAGSAMRGDTRGPLGRQQASGEHPDPSGMQQAQTRGMQQAEPSGMKHPCFHDEWHAKFSDASCNKHSRSGIRQEPIQQARTSHTTGRDRSFNRHRRAAFSRQRHAIQQVAVCHATGGRASSTLTEPAAAETGSGVVRRTGTGMCLDRECAGDKAFLVTGPRGTG